MIIKSVRIVNYKCFQDTGEIILKADINFIVGRNNSGKSALLETMTGRINLSPHRDFSTIEDAILESQVRYKTLIEKNEFEKHLPVGVAVDIELPQSWYEKMRSEFGSAEELCEALYERLFSSGSTNFQAEIFAEKESRGSRQISKLRSLGNFEPNEPVIYVRLEKSSNGRINKTAAPPFINNTSHNIIHSLFFTKVFYFGALRRVQGQSEFAHSTALNSDGSNLPQVLLSLQANKDRYARLMALLAEVFPDVRWISPNTVEKGIQLRVWSVETSTERDDLSIALDESGTGIGQALAIIYVLLTSKKSVIVIDEPASFLHPSAARALMRIISSFSSENQFIISTHSPETIAILRPDPIFMLHKKLQNTKIDRISGNDFASVQAMLREIGARLSDLFASDQIIWVEGPTEEICFPMILRYERPTERETYSIRALYNTGDLESRRASAETVWEIYRRLSRPNQLMPTVLAFSLDSEGRSRQKIEDIKRSSSGLVHFIDRRTYENYLIHPDAITDLLNRLPSFLDRSVRSEAVRQWIIEHGHESSYYKNRVRAPVFTETWLRDVDAPRLLKGLFSSLSNAQEEFQKTRHSVALTEWLLKNDPDFLSEIRAYVLRLVPD